jgi:hypothetical protein
MQNHSIIKDEMSRVILSISERSSILLFGSITFYYFERGYKTSSPKVILSRLSLAKFSIIIHFLLPFIE